MVGLGVSIVSVSMAVYVCRAENVVVLQLLTSGFF